MNREASFPILLLILALLSAGCTTGALDQPTLQPTIALPAEASTSPAAASTTSANAAPTATAAPTITETPTPVPTPTPTPVVLLGAGDIAYCGEQNQGDEITAEILARFPGAAIFTAGDNVYGEGTRAELKNCFGPSWGRFKDQIHPSPGNHDYMTESGAPYYEYFGAAAGPAGLGYYSFDLGDTHLVALNSNCNDIACGKDSRQAAWLREDLQANQKRCTLAYWHHPRWSSGIAGGSAAVWTFWRIAAEMGVDVVVNGHDHDYERFAPMDGEGNADPNGMREFVAGTGGGELREFDKIKANSEARIKKTNGVIKFNLYPDHYDWEFLPADGGPALDAGSGVCH